MIPLVVSENVIDSVLRLKSPVIDPVLNWMSAPAFMVISPELLMPKAPIVIPALKVAPASVGFVANTATPVPVLSVRADERFALEGVARNVATPAPNPLRPEPGYPVQFARFPEAGVPNNGAESVGPVANTTDPPLPVFVVSAENRFALDGVPKKVETPAARPVRADCA